MIKIAITGNLGTGKSTVCKMFEHLGIPVYYADVEAKRLMQESQSLKEQISEAFGKDVYQDGQLQRKILASKVFSDEKALQQLNKIVHPAVHHDMKNWFEKKEGEGYPIAIEEAALTFEAGHEEAFDKVITVLAPLELIIRRAIKRDGSNREDILKRLNRQWPQMEKAIRSDGIILNDEQHSLIFQVHNLIKRWDMPIVPSKI